MCYDVTHSHTLWPPLLTSCEQMIVWSRSTASGDPTSPSSPTLPVGQPDRPPPRVSTPHPTALSEVSQHRLQTPLVEFCHLTICTLRFPRRKSEEKQIPVVILWVPFEDWPQSAITLTLHFLVVILYTEQASIHNNDSGNADMLCTHEATDMNFERRHFYMENTSVENFI